MGLLNELKNLASATTSVIKLGSKTVQIIEAVDEKRKEIYVRKYTEPNLIPESDDIFKVEMYYILNMKDVLRKVVLEEYESNRNDFAYLYRYINTMLESVMKFVEVNYFYRKYVLNISDIPLSIDQYMNSKYILESPIYPFKTILNKLLVQIDRDQVSVNKKKFNSEASLAIVKDIIDSLLIE